MHGKTQKQNQPAPMFILQFIQSKTVSLSCSFGRTKIVQSVRRFLALLSSHLTTRIRCVCLPLDRQDVMEDASYAPAQSPFSKRVDQKSRNQPGCWILRGSFFIGRRLNFPCRNAPYQQGLLLKLTSMKIAKQRSLVRWLERFMA